MSLQDLQDRKLLQGLKLTREQIAERALEIMRLSQKDQQYMGTMQAVGRLITLAKACDSYWSEKVAQGKQKEVECLEAIAEGKTPPYWGYCNRILNEPAGGEEASDAGK